MLKHIDVYEVYCDACGRQLEDVCYGHTAWREVDIDFDLMYNNDWHEVDGKYYCSACSEELNIEPYED